MFTLGCDPEVLAFKGKHAIPAWILTDGTKKVPKSIVTDPEIGLKEQFDGMALEFNIDPVTINGMEDVIRFNRIIKYARRTLIATHQLNDLLSGPVITPSWFKDGWKNFGHPLAMEIGCDPDFYAHAPDPEAEREVPFTPTATNMRYMGGHIHVGYDVKMAKPSVMAKLLDLFVGLNAMDRQSERRPYYGLAGLYRPKPYGMEYRTLSNYWVGNAVSTWVIGCNINALMHGLVTYPGEMRELYRTTNWEHVRIGIEAEQRTAKDRLGATLDQYIQTCMPEVAERMFDHNHAHMDHLHGSLGSMGMPDIDDGEYMPQDDPDVEQDDPDDGMVENDE